MTTRDEMDTLAASMTAQGRQGKERPILLNAIGRDENVCPRCDGTGKEMIFNAPTGRDCEGCDGTGKDVTTMAVERTLVILTKQQAEQVEWAIGPMHDHWCTEDGAYARDGEVLADDLMPTLEPEIGRNGPKANRVRLLLSPNAEVNADLLYRVGEQLPQMAEQDDDPEANRATVKAARNAAARIRSRL